jgi:hypothetical protein
MIGLCYPNDHPNDHHAQPTAGWTNAVTTWVFRLARVIDDSAAQKAK